MNFYVDADILGLGKVLAGIRPDVTYPGDPGGRVKGAESGPPAQSAIRTRETRCGSRRLRGGAG